MGRTLGQVQILDVSTGKMVGQVRRHQSTADLRVAFSPDGRRLAGASYQPNIIYVWDTASGKELRQLKGQNFCQCLAFAPDGATLAVASGAVAKDEITVRLWNLATGKEVWGKDTRPWLAFDLAFSPDGHTLALVGGMPGRSGAGLRLWDAATGKELKHLESTRLSASSLPASGVTFSSDGRMLATGSDDAAVRLWEVASGRERQSFQGHQSAILAVSFSPDDRLARLSQHGLDRPGLGSDRPIPRGAISASSSIREELERCWVDLADADAVRPYRSIVALEGSPKEAIAMLTERFAPVKAIEPKHVAPLLAALDSDQFSERDKAMSELEKMGLAVEPVLRETLNTKPSLEIRRRIEAVLDKLAGGPRLRFLRVLEVLEHIATTERGSYWNCCPKARRNYGRRKRPRHR